MRSTALAGMSFGAGRPGTAAVVITTSKSGNPLLERSLLLRLLLGRELARVAAGRLLRADSEVEEGRAEALHLLGDGRSHVERRDDARRAAARSRSPAGLRRRRR